MGAAACQDSLPQAKSPAQACMARIGWPVIRYSKDWCLARAGQAMLHGAAIANHSKSVKKHEHPSHGASIELPTHHLTNLPTSNDRPISPSVATAHLDPESFIREVQQLMWAKVGIVRTGKGLREAVERLQSLGDCKPEQVARRAREACHIHTAALLIARSALARIESRGAHYRTDWPEHDDLKFRKHSVVSGARIR